MVLRRFWACARPARAGTRTTSSPVTTSAPCRLPPSVVRCTIAAAAARGYVTADERCRTSVDGVYAVGDIVPGLQLAHPGIGRRALRRLTEVLRLHVFGRCDAQRLSGDDRYLSGQRRLDVTMNVAVTATVSERSGFANEPMSESDQMLKESIDLAGDDHR